MENRAGSAAPALGRPSECDRFGDGESSSRQRGGHPPLAP